MEMQRCPDKDYQHILNYQYSFSKFVILKPLNSKGALEVAEHLASCELGPLHIWNRIMGESSLVSIYSLPCRITQLRPAPIEIVCIPIVFSVIPSKPIYLSISSLLNATRDVTDTLPYASKDCNVKTASFRHHLNQLVNYLRNQRVNYPYN
ncbi:hypothetical protein LOD99_2272 [Oopsacas minuta]|uniref:Uncharacterized protein n=1 Tax=Oopsacas minuta TaxID=111878 RepID=A0AAV7K2M7_9METZ|nr:hypothetical protein LOD99_2272 [Oopsacas minuta]